MTLVGLPVDFHRGDELNAGSALVIDASGGGLCLQTLNDIPIKRVSMKASFPKGNAFESFRIEAEIVWKDVYFWEGWEAYQYALRFVKILKRII